MYYNSRNNKSHAGSRNNSYNRGGRSTGGQYVWRVSWSDYNGNPRHKAFTNKQQAMVFMSNIDNGRNFLIDLEKWYG